MTLAECETIFGQALMQATLVLLVRDDKVLLAMKKRGFGIGKWNGTGGKVNPGETMEEAAVRECQEEIGVTPTDLTQSAILNFYFPEVPADKNWNQQVTVYVCRKWEGEPAESEEMKPQWFRQKDVPYKEMWWDDVIWMPRVLAGAKITASFVFGKDEKLEEYKLERADNF